jgi:small subunit ribosomal protein S18
LRRLVTEEGKIRPRRQTGTCAKHQRVLATAIKRSRHIALLPFSGSERDER